MSKVDTILEEIKGLTLLEASDLVKKMEEAFGVSAAAATVVAAGGGGAAAGGAAQERANRAKGIRLRNSRPVLIPKSWTLFGPPAAVCAAIPGRSFRTTLIFLSLVSPFFARQGCRLRPGRSRR